MEAQLRRVLATSRARLHDLGDRTTLVGSGGVADSPTGVGDVDKAQGSGLPDLKHLFRQPVFPPAVLQHSPLPVDSRTFAALVQATTAQEFLNALSLGCMVLGGAGLLG